MNDLISRTALLEWLCEGCNGAKKVGCGAPCCDYDLIQQAPAVDAEPVRHGRWVQSKVVDSLHSCSYCHVTERMRKVCNVYVLPYYCPNCGAKMDGGAEDATD